MPPLYLPYEFTSVLVDTDNVNPFGVAMRVPSLLPFDTAR